MRRLKIYNKNEHKEIERKLNQKYGISEIKGLIMRRGEERLFLYTGSLKPNEIKIFEKISQIERAGFYFARVVRDEIRLSIEGTHFFKDQISKNIFKLDDELLGQWMKGQELYIKTGKKEFLVMKHGEDLIGCGKASAEKISNFVPKSRRIKNRQN
jgi:NOL1/NOP2/fmu family ribosome biogenesis protein